MLKMSHTEGCAQRSCRYVTVQERELCASARMLPAHYLAVKAAMLREAARRGVLPRSEARTMFRLDHSRALKVWLLFDIYLKAGSVTCPQIFSNAQVQTQGRPHTLHLTSVH